MSVRVVANWLSGLRIVGGVDGTRTRGLRRDRPAVWTGSRGGLLVARGSDDTFSHWGADEVMCNACATDSRTRGLSRHRRAEEKNSRPRFSGVGCDQARVGLRFVDRAASTAITANPEKLRKIGVGRPPQRRFEAVWRLLFGTACNFLQASTNVRILQ